MTVETRAEARLALPALKESAALGRLARAAVPRSAHAELPPEEDRLDPIDLLESQAASRVPELVPIRYGRMASSPFAYFRGAALAMAADLAGTPASGITVQACGDAHLLNFGLYASPERRLVFDVNDFDETLPAPWEWDVKRLAASIAVAGRELSFSTSQRARAVLATVGAYRIAVREFARMRTLDVWYARLEADEILRQLRTAARGSDQRRRVRSRERDITKAAARTNLQAARRLSRPVDGRPQFVSQPPVVERLEDLLPDDQRHRLENGLTDLVASYARSLTPERRLLLSRFELVDMARKVVGVGSVGTRCWILLLLGRGVEDPLVLQAKEAQPSVLERFHPPSEYRNSGERVVTGQRVMQASSDIFLGWQRTTGIDGKRRDFYVRQLRDGKGSVDIDRMVPAGLAAYGRMCGWTLARAHARSGDRVAIAAYLGSSDVFDRAVLAFAEAYADRTERDHGALLRAVQQGRFDARTGV
jgi:uncharacterized protein (DUF2252 family)